MLRIFKYHILSIMVFSVVMYLSFFTPPETDGIEIPYLDKLVHFVMYGGFTSVVWLEYLLVHDQLNWKVLALVGLLFPCLLSGSVELLQEYCTDHRGGEWMDLVANCCGVGAGALFCYYVLRPKLWHYCHQKGWFGRCSERR